MGVRHDASVDPRQRAAYAAGRKAGIRVAVVTVLALGWVGVLVIGLAYAALLQLLGDLGCVPTPGSSNHGSFGWSVLPLGPTCTFTTEQHGFSEARGPTPVMSVWLALLVAGAVAFVLLLRSRRGAGDTSTM